MMTMFNPPVESLAHRSLEHSPLFQQAGLGQAAIADPRVATAALFTQRSLNPLTVAHRQYHRLNNT
jgi:hypothetical protein